jgi:hypothetical protein
MPHTPPSTYALVAALAFTGGACATAAPPLNVPPRADEAEAAAKEVGEQWAQHEDEVLTALAEGDPTMALRFGGAPSLSGPDAEVEADWLAPATRARGLAEAEAALGRWGDSARLPRTGAGRAWQMRLERELVIRAVREERFRADHEAALPRAASDLARAMAVAAAAAPSTDPQRAHERWVARRLEEIRASLKGEGLDAEELAELEDALDPMERGASATTTAALVRVRLELEAAPRAKARPADPARLEQALGAHAGTSLPLAVVRSRLDRAEAAAREGAVAYAVRLSPDDARRADKEAEAALFGAALCGEPDNPSRMRRASPPPERAATCAEVRRAAAAKDDRDTYVALVVLHDHVTVALWALARSEGGAQPTGAEMGHRLLSAATPETRARLARLAAVRPTLAVTAGLAAEMLLRRGADGVTRVAKAWTAFGDAPLDVVEREVTSKLP